MLKMGRIEAHKSRSINQKTYSKAPIYNNQKNLKSLPKQKVRKPFPKFEDLFLQKNTEESSPLFNENHDKQERKLNSEISDSSNDFLKSLNDTFDAIASMKISGKKNVKKSKCQISPVFTSSGCSENDTFQSACNSMGSEDMFSIFPLKDNPQIKEISPSDGCTSIKEEQKPNNYPLSKVSRTAQNSGNLAPPLHNLITSTPTTGCVNRAKKTAAKKTAIIENELSPVVKMSPDMFEISSASEPDTNFVSCRVNSFVGDGLHSEKFVTPHKKSQNIDLLQNNLKECRVHVRRLDSILISLSSGDSDKESECLVDDSIQEIGRKGCFRDLKSIGRSFHRVTRRRRICPSPFLLKDRKTMMLRSSRPDLKDSMYDASKFSMIAGSFRKHKMDNPSIAVNQSSSLSIHSPFAFKSGKGWRRTVKNISAIKKLQSSPGLSMSENLKRTSLESLNRSSILQFDPFDSEADEDPRKFVLRLCCQETELSLSSCLEKRIENCIKIGEGVYGEVFMYYDNSKTLPFAENRVLKIMPIEGDFSVNGEPQKSFREITGEIVVSKALSDLSDDASNDSTTSCFVKVYRCWCVKGSYPSKMLEMWDAYAEKKGTDNDRPDIFPDCQLYIILEFEFAGQDLESYVFNNALQAFYIFLQVVYALAVAEERLEFEHRDMHWGNILIRQTSESFVHYRLRKNPVKLKTYGVRATVIDFTMSRLRVDGRVFFNDLATDPSLFTAEGDYQFDIYRNMQKHNGNSWKEFNPVTNVLWLHYMSLKLINDCYYKNKTTHIHKEGMKKLRNLSTSLLSYKSAFELMCELENLPFC